MRRTTGMVIVACFALMAAAAPANETSVSRLKTSDKHQSVSVSTFWNTLLAFFD